MFKAEHKKWAQIIFRWYIDKELKKNFTDFRLTNPFPEIPGERGLLITPNHISWWDGFFIEHLTRIKLNRKIHLMMLEEQLKRFWFFQKVGAFSIDPQNPNSIIESTGYTRSVLSDKSNFVVIYPQGEIEVFDKDPVIKKGILKIIEKTDSDITVLPIAFRIQYYNEKKPALLCRTGKPLSSYEIKNNFSLYEKAFKDNIKLLSLDTLNKVIAEKIF